jgi:predicted Zn-dependent protease
LELLDQAPASQVNSLDVVIERNWALIGMGDTDAAHRGTEQGLKVSRHPDLLAQDGILKVREGQFDAARDDAEEILKKNPENTRAIEIIVGSYTAQQQPAKGIQRVREIAAARPGALQFQLMLGQLLVSSGERKEARKVFEAVDAAAPKLSGAKLLLAQLDLMENHLEAARMLTDVVVTREPRNVAALITAAEIQMRANDHAAAAARFRAVLLVDERNVLALDSLASLIGIERPDEALKLAQLAVEVAPDDAVAQDTLGWVYYRKGNYPSAAEHLKTAMVKQPTPRRQFHLALSYLKGGDQGLGQRTLAAALKQDPNLAKGEPGW